MSVEYSITENLNTNILSLDKVQEIVKKTNLQFKSHRIHLDDTLSLKSFADAIGTNTSYLSHVLNEVLNTSFTTLLNFNRIEEAKRILESQAGCKSNSIDNLDVIAENCGFKSVSAFHANFKRETGMTPGQYKKSLLEIQEKR